MTIIGLDLSLTATGMVVVVDNGRPSSTVIEPKALRGIERMRWVVREIRNRGVIRPDRMSQLILIEGFSFGSKGQAIFEIAGLGYLVRDFLYELAVPYVVVAPGQVKKFATGRGNVNKNIVLREVWKRWQFDAADDNVADAFVLMKIGQCLLGKAEPTTAEQRAVLKDLASDNASVLEGLKTCEFANQKMQEAKRG